MRRTAVVAVTLLALGLAGGAQAQQRKQKDLVLQQYLVEEFAQLNTKLDALAQRLVAAEAEIARLKPGQAELITEVRSAQTTAKTTDTSLANFRLSAQQDLLGLKTDLTQLRQDLSRLSDLVSKGAAPAPAPTTPPPAGPGAAVEGYITDTSERDMVKISLGSAVGVKVGTEFNVFKASEPGTQVGIIEVVEVIDANNSRAKIVYTRPNVRFEFSDIVRPR